MDNLAQVEIQRVRRVLDKLREFGLRDFLVTGSVALHAHRLYAHRLAEGRLSRGMSDLDIVVENFGAVPDKLAEGFLVRHVHPDSEAGKIVAQLVDAEERLRIDVFSARGRTFSRSSTVDSVFGMMRVVSIEDMASRLARVLLDLGRDKEVPLKHAQDFQPLRMHSDPDRVEEAWRDHRPPDYHDSFVAVCRRLEVLIDSKANLLVVPEYSQPVGAICPRCRETRLWRLAPDRIIHSILGYV